METTNAQGKLPGRESSADATMGLLLEVPHREIARPAAASVQQESWNQVVSRHSLQTESWPEGALRLRWEMYRSRLQACRRDPSEGSVHELRVSIRRLLSQVVLLSGALPGCEADKVRRALKRQFQRLGPLRDAQLVKAFIDQQLPRFPELYLVKRDLDRRQAKLMKSASVGIGRIETEAIELWMDRLLANLSTTTQNSIDISGLVAHAMRRASENFAETVQRYQGIDFSDAKTIHRTRVAFKKFRYIVECLPPRLTGLSKSDLRRLALYQRRMGKIQDLEVVHATLTKWSKQNTGLEGMLAAFDARLRRTKAQALRSFRRAGDQLLDFWAAADVPQIVRTSERRAA